MRNVTMGILLALVRQISAKKVLANRSVDKWVEKLSSKLCNRAPNASLLPAADLDNTTLRKRDKLEKKSSESTFDILACGHPIVDRTIETSASEMAQVGLGVGQEIADEKVLAEAMRFGVVQATTPGGTEFNTVQVASRYFGSPTAYVGCVGEDAEGDLLRKAASDAGITWLLPPISSERTAECAVLVDSKSRDRTLVVVRGAADSLCPASLKTPEVKSAIRTSKILYITSFLLTSPSGVAATTNLVKKFKSRKGAIAINLSSAGLQHKVAADILRLLPDVNLLFGNHLELHAFMNATNIISYAEVASALQPGGLMIITQGSKPAFVVRASRNHEEFLNDFPGRLVVFPVPNVLPAKKIVDMNCAGDSFVGGFLAAFAKESSLEDCMMQGHSSAAQTLLKRGC